MDTELFIFLIRTFGYVGIFLASLISSSSILFPLPGFATIFVAGVALNPIVVGIAAGLGAAFGELTGYALGRGGRRLLKRYEEKLEKTKVSFKKWGGDLIVFMFALLPFPFDIIGIFCGSINYDIKRFLLLVSVGKIIKYILVAYAGFYTVPWLFSFL